MMIREVMSHRQNKCNQHIKLQKQAGSTKQLRRNLIGMQATDQGQWHDHSVPSIRHQPALWLAPKIQRQAIERVLSAWSMPTLKRMQLSNSLCITDKYLPFQLKEATEDPQAKAPHQALLLVIISGIQESTDP